MSIIKIVNRLLEHFTKALYYEYPQYDEDGNLIGVEWFGLRGGRVEQDTRIIDKEVFLSPNSSNESMVIGNAEERYRKVREL